jgi:hypothetical protein
LSLIDNRFAEGETVLHAIAHWGKVSGECRETELKEPGLVICYLRTLIYDINLLLSNYSSAIQFLNRLVNSTFDLNLGWLLSTENDNPDYLERPLRLRKLPTALQSDGRPKGALKRQSVRIGGWLYFVTRNQSRLVRAWSKEPDWIGLIIRYHWKSGFRYEPGSDWQRNW